MPLAVRGGSASLARRVHRIWRLGGCEICDKAGDRQESPAGAAAPETAKPVHAPAAMLAAQAPSGRTREAASPVSIGLLPMRCAFAGLEAMKPPGGLQELMAPKALSPAVC